MTREVLVGDHRLIETIVDGGDRVGEECARCGLLLVGPDGAGDQLAATAPSVFRNFECDPQKKNGHIPGGLLPIGVSVDDNGGGVA